MEAAAKISGTVMLVVSSVIRGGGLVVFDGWGGGGLSKEGRLRLFFLR